MALTGVGGTGVGPDDLLETGGVRGGLHRGGGRPSIRGMGRIHWQFKF